MDRLKTISKRKLVFLIAVALMFVGGGAYLFLSTFGASLEPPTLELNTSSMAQGMARNSVKQIPGFAKFTDADVEAYSCNPKFEIELGSRTVNLFAKQKVTMKEIMSAIHPTKDSQYLIAFYMPASADEKLSKDTYYLYPTDSSPFVGGRSFDVKGIIDGEFEVPAYRGFQIIIDNSKTLFCKGSLFKTSTDNIWYRNDGEAIPFDAVVDILKSIRVLPKGWVLLPAGNNTSVIGGLIDLFGKDAVDVVYYQDNSGEFREFDYDKDWNKVSDTGTKLVYNTAWFQLKQKVNVAHIIDEILEELEK